MQAESTQQDLTPSDGMIRGTVRVTAVRGERAWVESESQTACGGCAATGSCGTHAISRYFGNKVVPLELNNDFDGNIGDRLEVGLMSTTLLKVAALIYLLPLAGLAIGALTAAAFNGSDGLTVAFGLVGLISGLQVSRTLYASKRFAGAVVPVVLKKLEPVESALDQSAVSDSADGPAGEVSNRR